MKVKTLLVSAFQTNCYIYYDEQNCFIIDPGDNPKKIMKFINEHQLHVNCIFLTHGHIDHIGAINRLYEELQCDVYIHEEDEVYLKQAKYNLSTMLGNLTTFNIPVKYYDSSMNIDGHSIHIHHTPGHTPGSIMIEFVDDHVIFSGDMLFKGSIGRYDFPLSSPRQMQQSIAYIKTFTEDASVYPGHGEPTSIFEELRTNPFFTH